jgi:oxygen-independent coproporphyrinogen III oxidase
MAGIYLHIPFCKQACNYCNFHFSTSLRKKNDLLEAMKNEILLQKDYLQGEKIESIYFGGGTPSILEVAEIQVLLDTIFSVHEVSQTAEITLEANPDDLTLEKLTAFKQTPINRFSIGIQSFFEEDLRFMNRAHDANEAENAIKSAQDVGFQNLTIDLIYGTPTLTDEKWLKNLEKALTFDIPHISSYCLTVEPKTPLEKQVKKGFLPNVNEDQSARQFVILMNFLEKNGFEHYEISNFSKPNHHAIHNSNYWLGKKYLGIGAAAHSYDTESRQYNIANNSLYIASLQQNNLNFEKEILTKTQQYNEYIMTALRTKWGAHLEKIKSFGKDFSKHFEKESQIFLQQKYILEKNAVYTLSKEGKMIADHIAVELFYA